MVRTPMLSPELQRRVAAELRPGERQVWAGQPLPRTYRGPSVVMAAFGLVFAAVGLAVAGGAAVGATHVTPGLGCFGLFGLAFAGIGLWLLTAPWWMARAAARTAYLLTDQRAVVIAGRAVGGGETVQSFDPDRLTNLTRYERSDGTGDLIFEQFTQRQGTGTVTVRRGFRGVPDVREVEALIHATLLAGRTRPVP